MKVETEFERRLREIFTEYRGIDPERAALALKDQPEATNEQIAQLSRFRPGKEGRGAPKPSKQTVIPPDSDLARVLEKKFNEKWPHLADYPKPEKPAAGEPIKSGPEDAEKPSSERLLPASREERLAIARKLAELYQEKNPGSPAGRKYLPKTPTWSDGAVALQKAQDWAGMLTHCRQWTQAEPDNNTAWFYLGLAYGRLGRHQEAIEAYREAVRIDPDYANVWYNLGLKYGELGRHPEAIEAYREAVRIDPDYGDAWRDLGLAYERLGRWGEAIEADQEALRLDPDDALAWNNLGVTYEKLGRHQDAIEAYQEALRLKPDFVQAWYNLGFTQETLGLHQGAIEANREALRLKPDFVQAWNSLGFTYGELGRHQEAIEAYREAVRLKPDYANAWYNLGFAYGKLGRDPEATEAYREAQRLESPTVAELENPEEVEISSPINQEKTKVIFRKTSDGRIIAVLPEIPYESDNNALCVVYEYIDKDTPTEHISFLQYLVHMGLLGEQEEADLGDVNELGIIGKLTKRPLDIIYDLKRTTKGESAEYNKLKNVLELHGFCIEVKDEVDWEMNQEIYEFIQQNYTRSIWFPPPAIIKELISNNNKSPHNVSNDDISFNQNKHNIKQKENVGQTVFTGLIIIVVGIIGLFFALIIVPGPMVIISILLGIIVGVVALCQFVGKWFSSQK